jgi:hypothetical protein
MRRVLLIAALALATLAAPARAAVWTGGRAPTGVRVERLVAEVDGSLVGFQNFTNAVYAAVGPGAPLVHQPATGLDVESLGWLLDVAGGLRMVDTRGNAFASTDHGATWVRSGQFGDVFDRGERDSVIAWAIDPQAPARAVRVHRDGAVQRSPDGGTSWFSASPLVVPVNESVGGQGTAQFASDGSVYVQVDTTLRRSIDLGDSWTTLPPAPLGRFVVSPVAPDVLWVAGTGGVYRSDDGGLIWRRRLADLSVVIPSSVDPLVAWSVGTQSVKITVDGGATWRSIAGAPPLGLEEVVGVALPDAATSICLAAARSIWCSNAGAPFAADEARTAHALIDIDALALDPLVADHAVAIAGRRVWESTDGSASWHAVALPVDDYASIEITADGTFVAGTHGVLARSRGAQVWRALAGPTGPTALAADPRTGTVFARSRGGLWRAAARRSFRKLRALNVRSLLLTPGSVGGRGRTVIVTGGLGLTISTDGGATFRRIRGAIPGGGAGVVLSPTDPRRLAVATGAGIYVSANLGRTWRRATRTAATTVTADPHHSGRWFAGSPGGAISVSNDNGRSWRRVSPVLPLTTPLQIPGADFCCAVRAAAGRVWATRFLEAGVWWRRVGV